MESPVKQAVRNLVELAVLLKPLGTSITVELPIDEYDKLKERLGKIAVEVQYGFYFQFKGYPIYVKPTT